VKFPCAESRRGGSKIHWTGAPKYRCFGDFHLQDSPCL
jgi:hypothetical protein